MAKIEREPSNQIAPESRFARSWAPGTWGVAGKLWLAFGLLVLVLGFSGLVSYLSLQRIDRNLLRIVIVEEPLEEAVLEMEINAGETARAVLEYVRELDTEHLEEMQDSEADFERFAAEFERLAETDEERRLGREVAGFYGKFKALGDEIVALADRRRSALETFRRDVLKIDELIDEKLQKAIDRSAPEAINKLEAALDMEINIDEAFAAIGGYVLHPDPALRREVKDAEADFERFEALYRKTSLSAEETAWLDQIDRNFSRAVTGGDEILAITDGLNTRLDEFEEILKTIDAVLDDDIQPLIHAETVAATTDAQTSTDMAALYLLVLGLVGLCIASVSARVITRAIIGPVRMLFSGTEIVGGGNLEHRIDTRSGDEFGHLAAAFNRMVEKLAHSATLLRDNEAQLRTVLDTAADAIITIDERGIVQSFNRTAERMFRYKADEVIGRNVRMLMPEPDRSKYEEYIGRYLRTGESAIIGIGREVTGRRKDGATFDLDLGIGAVRCGDRRIFVGTLHDLTERKRFEEQLRQAQKLEALGRLAGGIAHDFNNVLLPIITITEVTKDDLPPDGPLSTNLAKVLMAAQRGRSLVDQILKFSRRLPMDRRPVDLAEVVEEALTLVSAAVPATIEIRSDFEPGLGKVLADSAQIHEVLMNLVSNAAQSIGMKKGRIETTLREIRIDESDFDQLAELEPGPYARLTVSDTGSGMDAKTMAQIFDPFFTTKPVGEGTGLGLAAVHGIVSEHSGAITMSSRPERGTTFDIYLPVIETDLDPAADAEAGKRRTSNRS